MSSVTAKMSYGSENEQAFFFVRQKTLIRRNSSSVRFIKIKKITFNPDTLLISKFTHYRDG